MEGRTMSDAVWDDACRQARLSAYRGVVDALRKNVIHGDGRLYNPAGHNPLMMRAADLLEEAGVELTRCRKVHDTFKRDLDQGYATKDKQFAVDLLSKPARI
jgi:hypothetical protein